MSIEKTISGHYDSAFSLEHNNRTFTPKNVDPSRSHWNYYCVSAGESAYLEFEDPRYVQEFWKRYKEMNALYWSNRALADALEYERFREHMRSLRKWQRIIDFYPMNEVEEFFYMLLFPLIFVVEIALTIEEVLTKAEYYNYKCERKLQIQNYKDMSWCAREYLADHDKNMGTAYLNAMDYLVKEAAYSAQNLVVASQSMSFEPYKMERFANIEEIYNKVYEPSFRTFQDKQRPCRRYEGTYLEYIREGQHEMHVKKSQNKSTKNRKPSEAIELVLGIGDMDNTGYFAAFDDAKKSEAILKDYCNHLMQQKNVCFVTTKELDNPKWQPPFKHGLIVANLTVHCDEATPGIHMTVIPYSRGCKRGPEVQAEP